jgi:hypothetical protein
MLIDGRQRRDLLERFEQLQLGQVRWHLRQDGGMIPNDSVGVESVGWNLLELLGSVRTA